MSQDKRNIHLSLHPLRQFILLLDDPVETTDGGVVVRREIGCLHMDFYVVRVGDREQVDFAPGDRVIINHPDVGRRIRIDGTPYRLVRASDVVAVID